MNEYSEQIPPKVIKVSEMPPVSVDTTGLATETKQDAIISAIGAIPGGGGVQYTEGDIDASITGTAMLAEDGGNTLKVLQVDTDGHLIIHPNSESIALVDGINNTRHVPSDDAGNPLATPTLPFLYNGTTWDRAKGDATNGALVNLGANNDVTVTGSVAVTGTFWQATQPVSGTVTASAQPGVDIGDVTINNATIAVTQSGTWDEVGINDSGNSITVDAPVATPVFVRLSDGASAITTLPVSLATNTPTLQANSGVDIGDVTINNASGASAVNIQDGGNTITVDGTVGVSGTVTTKETRAATGANTTVADSATSVTILASNANRLGATVSNDSSAVLYLLLGSTTASATNYTVRMAQNGYYEVPFGYTGQLTGIWASDPGDGAARVTEITA